MNERVNELTSETVLEKHVNRLASLSPLGPLIQYREPHLTRNPRIDVETTCSQSPSLQTTLHGGDWTSQFKSLRF